MEQSIELAEELNETVGSQDNDLLIVLLDRNNVKQKTITAGEIFQNDQLSVLRLTRFLQIPLQ